MAEIVASLFGMSPMDTQQQLNQEDVANAIAIANLPQGKRAAFTGQLLGAKLSRGLLGAFGVQDPRLQRATTIEEALKEVNDTLTDKEKADPSLMYNRLADVFASKGLQQEAAMARAKAQEMGLTYAVKQSEITKNLREKDPKITAWTTLAGKSTPESVKASIENNYDMTKLVLKDGNQTPGGAYVDAINTLNDPNATKADKDKAFKNYQFLFPAVTSGAFGQFIPQSTEGGITFAPAPGSPEATKIAESTEKKVKQLSSAYNKSDVITSNINDALKFVTDKTTGSVGQATRALPFSGSSDAARLAGYIDTIKSNIGFDQLQKMRTESPTGGALGQVAVKELDYLQAAYGNLNPDLPADMLKQQLNKVLIHYNNFMDELEKEMQAAKAKVPSKATAPTGQTQAPQATGGKRVTVGDVTYERTAQGQWRKVIQ